MNILAIGFLLFSIAVGPTVTDDQASMPASIPGSHTVDVSSAPWIEADVDFGLFAFGGRDRPLALRIIAIALYVIVVLIIIYGARHYAFTLNRLFGRQRHPYLTIDTAAWPKLTVLIPAHNEELVISSILTALLRADYPRERLTIIPINDRSTDQTAEIIDEFVALHGDIIQPFHRNTGKPGKAAALADALQLVKSEIALVFDADYVPGKDLLKQLVAPFFDPEVGAVMGRVVPVNTGRNLLTRMLDMERSGGYQVDQQARMNLGLVPQYGGTVGGVRIAAVNDTGGWNNNSLTEDTDMTIQMVLKGWKIAYSNRYECYEEVPEDWSVRIKQIKRWASGHTEACLQYTWRLLRNSSLPLRTRIDGTLLLGVFLMAPILLIGWVFAIILFYADVQPFHGVLALLAVTSYNTVGNFASFFEIATAVRLDGNEKRIQLLPLNLLSFVVSLLVVSSAIVSHTVGMLRKKDLVWDKTQRYRQT